MPFDTQQPPYRMPCDQTAGRQTIYFGSEFQHGNKNATASVFVNTTQVPDPLSSGSTIPPYERFTIDEEGDTGCEVHHCTDAAPCHAWEKPIIANTFSASLGVSGSHVTESFFTCHKTGFKTVHAKKFPQGWRAYTDLEGSDSPNHVDGCGTASVSYRSYQTSSAQTKYLTLAMSSDWTRTDYIAGTSESETVAVTQTIDRNSGLYSRSDFSSTGADQHAWPNIDKALQGIGGVIGDMCTGVISPITGTTFSWIGGSILLTDDTFAYTIEQETYDIAAGTFSRDIYDRDSVGNVLLLVHEEYTVTETSIAYSSTVNTWTSPATVSLETSTVINVTGDLSDAYTSADVYAECIDMLSNWDLTDDIQCPWRTDKKVGVAPLVARDEQPTENFTTTFCVKDFGAPIQNSPTDPTTFPDPSWAGKTSLALSQDPSTGTTTIAIDFPFTFAGETFDSAVGNPFSHIFNNTGSLTYTVIGGSFPTGVTFDSATGKYSGTASIAGHWGVTIEVSCGIPAFTGDLMGAPLAAGYQNYFNFNFLEYFGCCFHDEEEGITVWDWWQRGWGNDVGTYNSNAGVNLPLNATNFNNFWETVNKPDGAFIFYADPDSYFPAGCVSSFGPSGVNDGGYLVCGKYAVIMDDWNSQNFLRPAGKDKFIYDETANHVFMISGSGAISGSGVGSTWGLLDLINQNPVPDGTDFSGIWGGPSVDGFYDVSYSGEVLTLGTKRFDVPSDWQSASDDNDLCFGKLRFSDAPSILGREAVTSVASGSGTVLTWANPQTCFALNTSSYNETIDIYNNKMTLLTSSINAIRIDDTSFSTTISSSVLKDGQAYYVIIHGAPGSWYMNDSTPKGDYLLLEWLSDYRSSREAVRISGSLDCGGSPVSFPTTNAGGGDIANLFAEFHQSGSCLPVVTCSPKVICISPNGEDFPNGHTYPFPETFIMDEKYGVKWWKWPQTVMTDLLWQQPHRKAGIGICALWKNDNFGCNEDIDFECPAIDGIIPTYYFAQANQVEARSTVPCNYGMSQNECAPAVPSDVQIGWLSPVDYAYGTGNVAFPPIPPGVQQDNGRPNGANLASGLHDAICTAMAGDCRFNYSVPGCTV